MYKITHYCVLVILCLATAIKPSSAQVKAIADSSAILTAVNEVMQASAEDPDKSLTRSMAILQKSQQIGYGRGVAEAHKAIGMVYTRKNELPKALTHLDTALLLSRQNKWPILEGEALNITGSIYRNIGANDKALELWIQSLRVVEAIKDTPGMANVYNNLAVLLNDEKRHTESDEYFLKAYDLYAAMNRKDRMAAALSSIAIGLIERKQYQEGYKYLMRSLKIMKIPEAYGNLASYYDETGKYDSAMMFSKMAIDSFEARGDLYSSSVMYLNLGTSLAKRGQLKAAEGYYLHGLDLAKKVSSIEILANTTTSLAEVYASLKDYPRAYDYRLQASKYKDSLFNAEKQAKLEELTVKFGLEEQESKNKLIQKSNDLKLQRKNFIIAGTVSAFGLLLVITLLLIRQSKLKANQQRLYMEQKQLRAQMNPHFIFNCLNSIQHFIVSNDVKNANKYLSGFASLMRQTLENSKEETITLQKEISYLENYLALECMRFDDKFSYSIKCSEDIDTSAAEIPSMIVQPYVENAIRHGLCYLKNKAGVLEVLFYADKGKICCSIDDNGIGREQSKKIKSASSVTYESQGMELTRRRLELASKGRKGDYDIEIIDKKDAQNNPDGTRVIIKFNAIL